MRYRLLITAILLFISAGTFVCAQQNPFLTTGNQVQKNAPETPEVKKTAASPYSWPGPFFDSAFMQGVRKMQKGIQATLSEYITDYRTGRSSGSLLTFLLFSYLYGLLHVLGPGHRKVFLFSYFVSRPSKWKKGMLAGFMTAVLHALSAIALILVLYFITSRTLMSRFNNITPLIERISYGTIILIGLYLLTSRIISLIKHNEGSDPGNEGRPDTTIFVLASGLIPCPGAATIMIFSIAVKAPLIGVYSVLAMSLGMATVLTMVPPAAIFLQQRLTPVISKWGPKAGSRIHASVSIAGAVALIILGLLFVI